MTDFLQLLFSGLSTGAIYGLAALGFTLLWQASGTINFAQGEFVMLPAFMMLAFMSFGAPLVASFVLSVGLAVLVLGWMFKRGIVDPLFKHGMMPIVVATIGLSIAMRSLIRAGYSAEASPFPSMFSDQLYNIAGVTITLADIGTFVLALALVFATQAFMTKTVTGRAMQAVAQNTESASVLGINVPRMIFYAFAINAVLAVAAALVSSLTGAYLPSDAVYFGEIGLSGAIRPVIHAGLRVKEAAKLGFNSAYGPIKTAEPAENTPLLTLPVGHISALVTNIAQQSTSRKPAKG